MAQKKKTTTKRRAGREPTSADAPPVGNIRDVAKAKELRKAQLQAVTSGKPMPRKWSPSMRAGAKKKAAKRGSK